MDKELQITVAGRVGTGKSTLMILLEEFLLEKGYDVELDLTNEKLDYGSEQHFRRLVNENLDKREEALKKILKIRIKTVQTQLQSYNPNIK